MDVGRVVLGKNPGNFGIDVWLEMRDKRDVLVGKIVKADILNLGSGCDMAVTLMSTTSQWSLTAGNLETAVS